MAGKDSAASKATEPVDKKPSKEDGSKSDDPKSEGDDKAKSGKPTLPAEDELNEEDQKLKVELEMLVERLLEQDTSLYQSALEHIKTFIKTSTSSMTAVPKPLKFLRPHYLQLAKAYETWSEGANKLSMADMLSVVGMTFFDAERRDTLKYRLLSPSDDLGSWGFEYMSHLALEIGQERQQRLRDFDKNNTKADGDRDEDIDIADEDLVDLTLKLVPYFLKHNAEHDACDILSEVNCLEKIAEHVDENTYQRVCLYLLSLVPYLKGEEDLVLNTTYDIYKKFKQFSQAMTIAIRLNSTDSILEILKSPEVDRPMRNQLAFILARQRVNLTDVEDELPEDEDGRFNDCLHNIMISELFQDTLAKDLNIKEPKVPDDIYKTHLENARTSGHTNLNTARHNLSNAFVNAFINMGFGNDKHMLNPEAKDASYIEGTKDHAQISAAASIGSIKQWEGEKAYETMDHYLESPDKNLKAGGILAFALTYCGIHEDADTVRAIITEKSYHDKLTSDQRVTQIMGLGIAYAGSNSIDVLDTLKLYLHDEQWDMRIRSMAALSIGIICVGSGDASIVGEILDALLKIDNKNPEELKSKWTRFIALGVGLLSFGRKDDVDVVLEVLKAVEHPISRACQVLAEVCAWAGSGDVIEIQQLIELCQEPVHGREEDKDKSNDEEEEKEGEEGEGAASGDNDSEKQEKAADKAKPAVFDEKSEELMQAYAVIGLGLVAMGEDYGQEMIFRQFGHLMHYGEPHIRRMVPLAMALVWASNPQMRVYDTLSRYTHDTDLLVAQNAIFAMGLMGAGTNNARLAQLLRQLVSYYYNNKEALFIVRIAQGLLHMGKGTVTVNPFHTDRQVLSRVAAAGLLAVMVTLIDAPDFVHSDSHYLLYFINLSVQPRWLVTLDEELKPLKVNVRVGKAVDAVGQAGKAKTITGWQTQSTPVLLGYGERAELENEEYLSLASTLEGIVLLKKNPDWEE